MVTVTDATCCGKYGIEDVILWKEKDAQFIPVVIFTYQCFL